MKGEEVTSPFNEFYKDAIPVANNIFVEILRDEKDDVTSSGIILSTSKAVQGFAKVLSVGCDVTINVEPGDFIEVAGGLRLNPNSSENEKAFFNQKDVVGVYKKK